VDQYRTYIGPWASGLKREQSHSP